MTILGGDYEFELPQEEGINGLLFLGDLIYTNRGGGYVAIGTEATMMDTRVFGGHRFLEETTTQEYPYDDEET
jgi:hypothetical protein